MSTEAVVLVICALVGAVVGQPLGIIAFHLWVLPRLERRWDRLDARR